MNATYVIAVLIALLLLGLAASVRILKQYERGVQFRVGTRQVWRPRPGVDLHHPAGRPRPPSPPYGS